MGEYKTFKELYGHNDGSETLKKLHPYNSASADKFLENILKMIDPDLRDSKKSSEKKQKVTAERNIDYSSIDEAIKLYTKLGFKEISFRERYYDEDTALIMEKVK